MFGQNLIKSEDFNNEWMMCWAMLSRHNRTCRGVVYRTVGRPETRPDLSVVLQRELVEG